VANIKELIGTMEYLTQWTMWLINRCHYNRIRLYSDLRPWGTGKRPWTYVTVRRTMLLLR